MIVAKTDDVIGSIVSIALAIKDEDVINVFLPQVGDIGIFVSAAELWQQPSGLFLPAPSTPGVDIGVQWLMQPTLPSPLPPPEAVAALALSFNAASNARARTGKYSFPCWENSTMTSKHTIFHWQLPSLPILPNGSYNPPYPSPPLLLKPLQRLQPRFTAPPLLALPSLTPPPPSPVCPLPPVQHYERMLTAHTYLLRSIGRRTCLCMGAVDGPRHQATNFSCNSQPGRGIYLRQWLSHGCCPHRKGCCSAKGFR